MAIERPSRNQWATSVVLAIVTLCGYYVFSCLTPLVTHLIDGYHFTHLEIAVLQCLFYSGCIAPVFLAARFADCANDKGLRWLGIWLGCTIFLGALLSLIGIQFRSALLGIGVGRFVCGFAIESLVVVIMAYLANSFTPTAHALVFGLNTAAGRAGSVLALLSGGWIGKGTQAVHNTATATVVAGLISAVGMYLFRAPADVGERGPFSIIDRAFLSDLQRVFWIFAVGGAAFYGAYYGFEVFSQHYVATVFGWSDSKASTYTGLMLAISAILTPIAGKVAGKSAKLRFGFMTMAIACLLIGLELLRHAKIEGIQVLSALLLIGLATALFVPAFWTELAAFAPKNHRGTVFGAFTVVQLAFQAFCVLLMAVRADSTAVSSEAERVGEVASLLVCTTGAGVALVGVLVGLQRKEMISA